MSQTQNPGYRQWADSAPPEFKKQLIRHFVEETLAYAHDHIAMREQELTAMESNGTGAGEVRRRKERLERWYAYVEFQEHTLKELQSEKLDRFIE